MPRPSRDYRLDPGTTLPRRTNSTFHSSGDICSARRKRIKCFWNAAPNPPTLPFLTPLDEPCAQRVASPSDESKVIHRRHPSRSTSGRRAGRIPDEAPGDSRQPPHHSQLAHWPAAAALEAKGGAGRTLTFCLGGLAAPWPAALDLPENRQGFPISNPQAKLPPWFPTGNESCLPAPSSAGSLRYSEQS